MCVCPCVGSQVCSQHAIRGYFAQGRGEIGSEPPPQCELEGTEIVEASLGRFPDGGEGIGGGYPL
jgi:hypothetical protein